MTQATLRTVALKTVDNYSHAAEAALGAYRTGGHRLVAAVQRRVDRVATRSADVLVPQLVAMVRRTSEQMGAIAVKGVDAVTMSTERAIELGKAGFTAQVERVATFAGRFDNSALANGLDAAARLSLPGAKAALKVSERVAANADKMAGTITGKKAPKAAAKPVGAVATAQKRAKKAVRTVKRAARKAVAQAAPAKAPRARRAAAVSTETQA